MQRKHSVNIFAFCWLWLQRACGSVQGDNRASACRNWPLLLCCLYPIDMYGCFEGACHCFILQWNGLLIWKSNYPHTHFMLVTSGPVLQNCCITTALDTLCVRCGCHTNCKDLFNLYWSLCCLFARYVWKTGKSTGKLPSEICMNWLNKISLVLYVCMTCISCLLHVINWTVFSLRGKKNREYQCTGSEKINLQ